MLDEVDTTREDFDGTDSSEREPFSELQVFVSRAQFSVRHTLARSCEFESHSHTSFTVTAVLSGSMSITIGSDDFELPAGEVALTGLGQAHAARASRVEFVSIGISPALVNELVAEIGLTRITAEIVFRAVRTADESITQIARSIISEISVERLGHGVMLDALVRQLVVHLLRSHLTVRKAAQIELSRAGPVDRRLRRAIEFMHDNYERELALEEIASAAYLSEYHFARLFKQITGVTPHVYLANVRLEHARRLLAETSLSISQVATRVGYQSQSHFTKIFKSVTGVTPRTYRDSAIHR
ncbi:MAG TPA: AraC family transcriptional regulator [Blastocatellia bacterium]|jgi:AraC family transcriptional regulator